jgi:arylsulfatase
MIDYLDMSIGRLFNYLNKTGQYDNTLVIFFSDNGANGATAYAYPGNDDGAYLSQFNNELDNRGRPNSFVETGAGWAQASSCPFRLFKSFTSQGGIKSPMIIKMPKHKTNIGSWNHSFIHVTDIMPTILDITSAKFPGSYNDRTVAQPIGKSIVPLLAETKDQMHAEFGMGWELFEMKAYIKGNWKILRLPKPFGTGKWQLFDLENDPGEIHDISEQYPDKKIELLVEYDKYLSKNNVYDHNGYFDESYRKMYRIDDD